MEYLSKETYDYVMQKYHPKRWARNDAIFTGDSGLSGEEILAGIREQDEKLQALPHEVRKARAFAFVLKNTRISCDSRDLFPAINMVDRPLNQTVLGDWRREVFSEIIPEVEEKRRYFEKSGIARIWPDYDHAVPRWDVVFELGFAGILQNSEAHRTPGHAAFFDGINITYTAIIDLILRLKAQAEKQGSLRMAKALEHISKNPPATFYQALLVSYLFFMIHEHIDGMQARSLSGFDRTFYRFYKSDLENGISEEELRHDLACYFLQFTAINNYWNQPVFLGGCKADGATEINELSYFFLDVYDKMGIYNPKIQIKVADSTPKDFLLKALDMIRRGNNCIVFVNDATVRRALIKMGSDPEAARLCNITGCYEYSENGGIAFGMNYVNLLKPLEYALHNGCDGISGDKVAPDCPDVSEYASFEQLFETYKTQLEFIIDNVIEIVNSFEDYLSYINPQLMLSATYPTCLKQGKDALCGGASTNDSVMLFGFMADVADSLTNIKKYVFEKKLLTLGELRYALDHDFEGNETLRRTLLADRDKYGNNKDLPDGIAKEIADFVCTKVNGRPNAKKRGGQWALGFHVARMSYDQAPLTASSPNGRRRGEELSKNLSASMGMNREGATAAILSVTKIDATQFAGDACLDLGLLPSSVKGEAGLMAMYGLLMTFIKRGGHAMHINVFDAETLRDAQKHPEKYSDLQIRVCGWNALWNNINKKEQDGFLRQAGALK